MRTIYILYHKTSKYSNKIINIFGILLVIQNIFRKIA